MAERMTVRQFLGLGPNEQPSVMAAEGLWNEIGTLKDKVARLEAANAALRVRAEAVISNAFQLCRVAPDYKPNREALWASARELDRILQGDVV